MKHTALAQYSNGAYTLANTVAVGMAVRPWPAHVTAVLLHDALERFFDKELGQVVAQRMAA